LSPRLVKPCLDFLPGHVRRYAFSGVFDPVARLVYRAVLGHDYDCLDALLVERLRKRAGHVGQAAGLGERYDFG